jgi:hypothetical protein
MLAATLQQSAHLHQQRCRSQFSLRANLERHKETNGAVANRALELIGKELGLFINRKDITHTHKKDDLDDMNERELALEHVRVAQLFLEMCEENEETENNDGE